MLFLYGLPQQYGNTHQFQRGHSYQLQVATIADALGHRHTDAQTRIRTRAAAHGNTIKRDGVTVSKRQSLIDHAS